MNLCKYKNVLGEPKKGIHSYRLFDVAIMDVIMTILAAIFIAWISNYNFWLILGGLFVTGIILHHLFCVRTTVDKMLFS